MGSSGSTVAIQSRGVGVVDPLTLTASTGGPRALWRTHFGWIAARTITVIAGGLGGSHPDES